VTTLLNKIIC